MIDIVVHFMKGFRTKILQIFLIFYIIIRLSCNPTFIWCTCLASLDLTKWQTYRMHWSYRVKKYAGKIGASARFVLYSLFFPRESKVHAGRTEDSVKSAVTSKGSGLSPALSFSFKNTVNIYINSRRSYVRSTVWRNTVEWNFNAIFALLNITWVKNRKFQKQFVLDSVLKK